MDIDEDNMDASAPDAYNGQVRAAPRHERVEDLRARTGGRGRRRGGRARGEARGVGELVGAEGVAEGGGLG